MGKEREKRKGKKERKGDKEGKVNERKEKRERGRERKEKQGMEGKGKKKKGKGEKGKERKGIEFARSNPVNNCTILTNFNQSNKQITSRAEKRSADYILI